VRFKWCGEWIYLIIEKCVCSRTRIISNWTGVKLVHRERGERKEKKNIHMSERIEPHISFNRKNEKKSKKVSVNRCHSVNANTFIFRARKRLPNILPTTDEERSPTWKSLSGSNIVDHRQSTMLNPNITVVTANRAPKALVF